MAAFAVVVDKYVEVKQKGDDHVTFQVHIKDDGEEWLVWRRFTQFQELHAQLIRNFNDLPAPPTKRTFGKMFGQGTGKFLEGRREELNTWLQQILSVSGVVRTQELDQFLNFEKNEPPAGIVGREDIVFPKAKVEPKVVEAVAVPVKEEPPKDAAARMKARRTQASSTQSPHGRGGESFARKFDTNAMMRAMCQIHPHQPLSLYCVDTKEMVCASCVILPEHRTHTIQEIPDSSTSKFHTLIEKIKTLHSKESILQEALDRIQKLQNNLSEQAETKEGNIRITMKAVREFIDEKEDELISATMEKELSITLMLQKQRSNRWALSRYFSRLIKAVQDAANEEDNVKFLQRWGVAGGSKLENEMDKAIDEYAGESPVANNVIPEWLLVNENHMPNFLESEIRRMQFEEQQEGGASAELPIRYEQFEAASKLQEKRDLLMQRLHTAQIRVAAIEKESADRKRSISNLTNAVNRAAEKKVPVPFNLSGCPLSLGSTCLCPSICSILLSPLTLTSLQLITLTS